MEARKGLSLSLYIYNKIVLMKKSRLKEIIREELNENQNEASNVIASCLASKDWHMVYYNDNVDKNSVVKFIVDKLKKAGYEISKTDQINEWLGDLSSDFTDGELKQYHFDAIKLSASLDLNNPILKRWKNRDITDKQFIQLVNKDLKEEEKGAVKLKKDTPERDIKKFTDQGLDVELNEDHIQDPKKQEEWCIEQIQDMDFNTAKELAYIWVSDFGKTKSRPDLDDQKELSEWKENIIEFIKSRYDENPDEYPDIIGIYYADIESVLREKNNLNEDKFNLVAKNLIQTEKDIKQLVKKLKKAEPGEKQSIAKLLKKKMEVKKELQSHKKQLDEDRK